MATKGKPAAKAAAKPAAKAAAKPAAKKPAPKTKAAAKPAAKKPAVPTGSKYTCSVCGMVVSVDTACGCVDACDLICCEKPMKLKKAKDSAKA